MKRITKKQITLIFLFCMLIISVFSIVLFNNSKIEMSKTTTAEAVGDTTDAEVTTKTTTEVDEPTVSTTVSTTAKPKVETTTKKVNTTKAETTTKKVTTTKAETTTKKSTGNTYNGYEPYEVFVDESKGGGSYYYDENGKLWCAEALTTKPNYDYDNSYCHVCGSKDCIRAMSSYYCVVCEKEISALTCHSKSHYEASH